MPQFLRLLLATVFLVGCGPTAQEVVIRGVVTAGPTCPVVTVPPDPGCEDRPVANAEIVVIDSAGEPVARVRSAADGTFATSVVPGNYVLRPQPAEGLLGTAPTVALRVDAGVPVEPIAIAYDTGIR